MGGGYMGGKKSQMMGKGFLFVAICSYFSKFLVSIYSYVFLSMFSGGIKLHFSSLSSFFIGKG